MTEITVPRRTVVVAAWSAPAIVTMMLAPFGVASETLNVSVTMWRSTLLPGETSGLQIRVRRADGSPAAGVPVAFTIDGVSAFLDQSVGVSDDDGSVSTLLRVRTTCNPGDGTLTAAVSGSAATTTFSVVTRSLIRHSMDGLSTGVIALPHGDQEQYAAIENRGMPHSDAQPTGRWVRAGDVLTIDVDASPTWWLEIAIGSRGPMAVFASDGSADLARTILSGGTNTVVADRDGLVFVINHSEWSAVTINIRGGRAHPVWEQGVTTRAEFEQMRVDYADAPIVTHVADRVFADVQRRVLDAADVAAVYDPAELTSRLERIRELTDEVYGLSYDAVGVGRKNPGRIYIAGPDSGEAYAFATAQWLSLHVSSGASAAMVKNTDLWVLWHEMGHTYQTPNYTWTDLGEVTVNISSLALQKTMTGQNMLDESPGLQQRIQRYFAQPPESRDFASLSAESPFYPLFLFDQLRRSFGDAFYAALSQRYRVSRARGLAQPTGDRERMDAFVSMTSAVAGRNLTPFFVAWGVPISADVVAQVACLPQLGHDIWTPLLTRDAPLERMVTYNPPTGTMSSSVTSLQLGETEAAIATADVRSLDGSPSVVVSREAVALQIGPGAGKLIAVLEAQDATPEVLQRVVPVIAVSALEFVGFYDVMIGSIGVSQDGSRLVATSLGNLAHPFFAGQSYYSIEVLDTAGVTVASAHVNGEDDADAVVSAIHGCAVSDGYAIMVRAAEPSRVHVFQDSRQVGSLTVDPQTIRISSGRFVL